MSIEETIPIEEITRLEPEGRVVYVYYQGRVLRRPGNKTGNPAYTVIHGFKRSPFDRVKRRRINVNSKLGRKLLAKV